MLPAASPLFLPPEAKRPNHHRPHPTPFRITHQYYSMTAARNDHPVYTSYLPIIPYKEQKKSPLLLTDERYPVLPFSSAVFLDKSFLQPCCQGI